MPANNTTHKTHHRHGAHTSITERQQTHNELEQITAQVEQAQQRLHDLFMQTPAMIAVGRGPELVYELVNPVFLEVTGKTEDIIGKGVLEVFPELADQKIIKVLLNVYKTGEPFVGHEVPVKLDKRSDGRPKTFYFTFVYQPIRDSNGLVDGVITHAVDVTEHVMARKRAEESEAHFRFMAELLPQKIFTADPNGKVIYFNSQWAEYTGLPLKRIQRQGVQQLVHPDDLSESMRSWRQAIKTGEPLQNEQRLRRGDGQYRRHVSYVRAMRDESGAIVRWFGSMTDVEDIIQTAARKEELELKTAALQEQRNQLIAINNAKDEFISIASHQLRTPATSVKQYLAMLLEGYAGKISGEQQEFLQRAYNGNERQLKIVNQLLKVALVDAGKVKLHPERVGLELLIGESIEAYTANFTERKQKVSFCKTAGNYTVSADRELLRMVLENLIDNASKYTYENKTITVSLQKSKGNVEIIIQDEGVGIPKAKLDKLFQKFSRIDNPLSVNAGGSGLGLYWVGKIIELHRGTITVVSQESKGTTFTVALPL